MSAAPTRKTSIADRRVANVEADPDVERIAVGLDPELRSLDAFHLASAAAVGDALAAFVCYNGRLTAAAERAGLPVAAPGTT